MGSYNNALCLPWQSLQWQITLYLIQCGSLHVLPVHEDTEYSQLAVPVDILTWLVYSTEILNLRQSEVIVFILTNMKL